MTGTHLQGHPHGSTGLLSPSSVGERRAWIVARLRNAIVTTLATDRPAVWRSSPTRTRDRLRRKWLDVAHAEGTA